MPLEVIETDDGGHRYEYDGKRVPGLSSILQAAGLADYGMISAEVLEAAAVRGKDVHLACEDLDRGRNVDWAREDPVIAPRLAAWEKFKKEFRFQPARIEEPQYDPIHDYACTPDRHGLCAYKGESHNATVEIKATAKIAPWTGIQLAAQALMEPDHYKRLRVAVRLQPTGKYEVRVYDNFTADAQLFFAALTIARWRHHHLKLGDLS